MDQENTTPEGLSRRDLLRRGAALGGALAWATPVVQVIGMSPALANSTSPVEPECVNFVTFRAKAEWTGSSWQFEASAGIGANDCDAGCNGATGVNGANYLTITGDATSATICVKDTTTTKLVGMLASKAGQDCESGSGSSECQTVDAGDHELSNITVCFEFCVED